MSVQFGPLYTPLVAVAPELPEMSKEADESADLATKCGRCRLSFLRHPSIAPGDSARWWLCPPCRMRLLGDESKTNSRWQRFEWWPRNSANPGNEERQHIVELTSLKNRNEDGRWSKEQ
jgi:hypothetical protein